jgi:hypothetical protein
MFDAGRTLVFLWALAHVLRARSWLAAIPLAVTGYLFALAVASGVALRDEGPMSPVMAIVLGLMGPSAMPRGHLPPLPLASAVIGVPAIVNVVLCAVLVATARRMIDRAQHLPQFSEATRGVGRAATAIILVAVFEGLAASLRLLPDLLDWGAG